jgi:hypothetical protein
VYKNLHKIFSFDFKVKILALVNWKPKFQHLNWAMHEQLVKNLLQSIGKDKSYDKLSQKLGESQTKNIMSET